jgi:hypothetical protein
MTDLTPTLNGLLTARGSALKPPSTKTADEFLKEAYRIVSTELNNLQSHTQDTNNPELPHNLPSKIPPLNPAHLPLDPKTRQPVPIPIPAKPPHRPRTRRSRHINSPPPPRPSNFNRQPLLRRVPPPGNIHHPPPQEIRTLRRWRRALALGGRE